MLRPYDKQNLNRLITDICEAYSESGGDWDAGELAKEAISLTTKNQRIFVTR